jgi:hypothetical protein
VLKHHPGLLPVIVPLEFGVRLLKDTFASGPVAMNSDLIVLVGMHHKTGSVLARKLFASACLRVKQCGVFLVTSGSELDVKRTLQDPTVRLVSHPQWPWMPQQLIPIQRPYLFIHFWRNPASKLSSGYLYHKTGVERYILFITFLVFIILGSCCIFLSDFISQTFLSTIFCISKMDLHIHVLSSKSLLCST